LALPVNILISDNFPPHVGGSSRWFYELYRRLPADERVIAAGEHPAAAACDADFNGEIERMPLRMSHWGMTNRQALAGYTRAWRRLGALIKRVKRHTGERPILHAARCLPEGWLAWMLAYSHGVRYAVFVHGEDVTAAATSREYRTLVHRVFAKASRVIANSENTAELLRQDWRLHAPKLCVLTPGVDTQRFVPGGSALVRAELGWNNRFVVLTIGRLQRRKGQDHMLRAVGLLRERFPDLLYCIVGDGEERARLEAIVEEMSLHDHVQLLGEVNDQQLLDCYQNCDLFALPNRTLEHDIEGFGMVLIEAQACGKPVLAGNSGGTRETLDPGRTGWIVDCDQPESIATALADILSARERLPAMGSAARQWAVERFDWEALVKRARGIFAELGPAQKRMLPAEHAA
jgi:phosphatidylinositol alpha-1,6-mannosyltransferase